MFGDDEIIFQDVNASCHRAKSIKVFLQETYQLNVMASKQYRFQSNLWWKLKKENGQWQESWNQLGREFCFSLVKCNEGVDLFFLFKCWWFSNFPLFDLEKIIWLVKLIVFVWVYFFL